MKKIVLVTVWDGEIEVDTFDTEVEARLALMRDIYEMGQDTDLPDDDTDEVIVDWVISNGFSFFWSIKEIEV